MSQKIFMVLIAEKCAKEINVSPTPRFAANHEGGFWGSQSGLEPPPENYKALCF